MCARLCAHPVLECVTRSFIDPFCMRIIFINPSERQAGAILFDKHTRAWSPVENVYHQAAVCWRIRDCFEWKRRAFDFECVIEDHAAYCFVAQ